MLTTGFRRLARRSLHQVDAFASFFQRLASDFAFFADHEREVCRQYLSFGPKILIAMVEKSWMGQ